MKTISELYFGDKFEYQGNTYRLVNKQDCMAEVFNITTGKYRAWPYDVLVKPIE